MATSTLDVKHTSYWFETGGYAQRRAPLDGSIDVDVAIVGAGFTGLWTAYYLLANDPSLKVAVVEKNFVGFGASGRNGGWCSSGFPVSPAVLLERFGAEKARRLVTALYDTVDEVGRVLQAENISADYQKSGSLRIARGNYQVPIIRGTYEAYKRLGLADHYELLDARELESRIRVRGAVAALFNRDCAVVHPGKLVQGIAQAFEAKGGVIYEQTPVTDFQGGTLRRLVTPRGDVRADVVVLAGEAYLSQFRKLHRQIIPVYSLIVLTEPLPEAVWQEIGWRNRECVASARYTVDYLSQTADGRILLGGRGAPYRLGSAIDPALETHKPTHAMLKSMLEDWFPVLKGVRVTHAWGGPLGVTRDWMPTVSYDRASGVAMARGYGGQGVATANLAGRTLAELILAKDSPRVSLPMVGHTSPNWEPEPLRWLGVRLVQWGMKRIDDEGEKKGKVPTGRSWIERLARH